MADGLSFSGVFFYVALSISLTGRGQGNVQLFHEGKIHMWFYGLSRPPLCGDR